MEWPGSCRPWACAASAAKAIRNPLRKTRLLLFMATSTFHPRKTFAAFALPIHKGAQQYSPVAVGGGADVQQIAEHAGSRGGAIVSRVGDAARLNDARYVADQIATHYLVLIGD